MGTSRLPNGLSFFHESAMPAGEGSNSKAPGCPVAAVSLSFNVPPVLSLEVGAAAAPPLSLAPPRAPTFQTRCSHPYSLPIPSPSPNLVPPSRAGPARAGTRRNAGRCGGPVDVDGVVPPLLRAREVRARAVQVHAAATARLPPVRGVHGSAGAGICATRREDFRRRHRSTVSHVVVGIAVGVAAVTAPSVPTTGGSGR